MEINSRWIARIKLSVLHSIQISNNSKELRQVVDIIKQTENE